jgi:hypothetical protein
VTDRELYRSLAGELEWKAISLPLSERKMLRGPRLLLLLLLPSSESDSMGRLELWSGLEEYEAAAGMSGDLGEKQRWIVWAKWAFYGRARVLRNGRKYKLLVAFADCLAQYWQRRRLQKDLEIQHWTDFQFAISPTFVLQYLVRPDR